ncbi:hypothetical protein A2738_00080 [Candidatus Nomurabacteria bacterium RIFCSPHIGHO2_01_FULL_42_15]|uniref:DUF5671 domain-containing protein n=1 Tax=Candidatus Nomurabacteria bacterium RIFCSPHIGHO2_01_FULL_42_15 TaxID=1801742 RepID=A0A1F6VGK0_9BACT|nr:MAG: hypothetical protein A2738_00080 [Candidatus Nomurabacteria bacterium RIFCSPHIGHO2_01_FULL_42_15]OGI92865.1 MAG: hypothetical protein A3A99_02350 [Candidatus Nomurabacteria bacterium RIFCSPLOWO2_01_FULL_41_18]
MNNILKNPYINALLAALYIIVIVFVIGNLEDITRGKESLLVPVIMLSLFVLSAAIMGLFFVYTPAKMFLDNQKPEALTFFLKTIGTFAGFAIVALLMILLL